MILTGDADAAFAEWLAHVEAGRIGAGTDGVTQRWDFGLRVVGMLAVGLLPALDGCDGPKSRPYNPRPGYLSSKNMRPVKVDLYRYADKGAKSNGFLDGLLYDEFEIIDEPPLSFRFPDAYYHAHPNHKGGAQTEVGIHFDLDTMKPATLAPIVFPFPGLVLVDATSIPEKYRKRTSQEVADYAKRYIFVQVVNNSNLYGGGYGGHGALPTNADLIRWPKLRLQRGDDGAKDAGVINGMQIINYTEKYKGYTNLRIDPPVYVENFDIENNEIGAFPVNPSKNIVQSIECDRISNNCKASFVYHSRTVMFHVNNQHFLDIELVAQKVIQLLDKYRLPPARKGDY
ncbi:MAG: hypothetical protein ACKVOJ_14030 [Sphingomonadaceae bacterium]